MQNHSHRHCRGIWATNENLDDAYMILLIVKKIIKALHDVKTFLI